MDHFQDQQSEYDNKQLIRQKNRPMSAYTKIRDKNHSLQASTQQRDIKNQLQINESYCDTTKTDKRKFRGSFYEQSTLTESTRLKFSNQSENSIFNNQSNQNDSKQQANQTLNHNGNNRKRKKNFSLHFLEESPKKLSQVQIQSMNPSINSSISCNHQQNLQNQQPASPNKMILYKTSLSPKSEENFLKYKGEYYPPPAPLNSELTKKIQMILNRQDSQEFHSILKQVQEQNQLKRVIEKKKNQPPFINPKAIDLFQKRKFSKMQKSYINNYQNLMRSDKSESNQIEDNSKMVDNLLFSQLSASAISSHNWQSKQAQINLISLTTECPDLIHYPLNLQTIQNIKYLQDKQYFRKNQEIKRKKKDEDFIKLSEIQEKLVLDTNQPLDQYLDNYVKLQHDKEKIYQTKIEDLKEVLDYCYETKEDNHKIDSEQAYDHVIYLQQKKLAFAKQLLKEKQDAYYKEQKILEEKEQNQTTDNQIETMPLFRKSILSSKRTYVRSTSCNKNQQQKQSKEEIARLLGYNLEWDDSDIFVVNPRHPFNSGVKIERIRRLSTIESKNKTVEEINQ